VRAVSYALAVKDGKRALESLLSFQRLAKERAEQLVAKDIAEKERSALEQQEQQARVAPEPDEALVEALHRLGVSRNRARRACIATDNGPLETALSFCFERASDPSLDAPLPPRPRPHPQPYPQGMAVDGRGTGVHKRGQGEIQGWGVDSTGGSTGSGARATAWAEQVSVTLQRYACIRIILGTGSSRGSIAGDLLSLPLPKLHDMVASSVTSWGAAGGMP
ncbi:unnamed protein product, partial [Discosporangium mesarthrocarpum]